MMGCFTMPSSALARTVVIALLPCFFLLSRLGAEAASRFQPPEWLEVRPVSQSMVISGLPSGARHLVSRRPVAAVLDYFRDLWDCGSGAERCRLAALPPWQVLSRFDGRELEYVQVRESGLGATGYLASSEIADHSQPPGAVVPAMQGSRIIHDLTMDDPGKRGRILQLSNSYSVASNTSYYQNYFAGRNWSRQVAEIGDQRSVLVFHKGRSEAHVVLTRQDGMTYVVINMVQ